MMECVCNGVLFLGLSKGNVSRTNGYLWQEWIEVVMEFHRYGKFSKGRLCRRCNERML